ncbi:MAG: iron ABC transporter permease [Porticoccaceae bacterium]|nr:iron ABC transporter permease [Pseudomonadales bacterium]MCP5303545.1 iron ABC transporter permease [Pseudomonadales bacterium]
MTAPRLFFILALILPAVVLLGLAVGPVVIPLSDVFQILVSTGEEGGQQKLILEAIRLPRVVLALLVGMLLASCGAVLQGLFRNPLADPTLIGVSAGASAGASAVIVLGTLWAASGQFAGLPLVAVGSFLGALLAAVIVFRLATSERGTSVATMLLAGIAISALAGAINQLFSFFADNDMLRRISLWQMGNLDNAGWLQVSICLVTVIVLSVFLPRESRALNAMLLGESEARHLGVGVEWLKRRLIFFAALGVGVAVAVAGTVAFVGLMVPHLVRLLIGPDHRYLIPASALSGAMLMVVADALARIVVAPAELPVGVVTALLGAPFFVMLLVQHKRG